MKPDTVPIRACEVKHNSNVSVMIDKEQALVSKRNNVTTDTIIDELL